MNYDTFATKRLHEAGLREIFCRKHRITSRLLRKMSKRNMVEGIYNILYI